MAGGWRRTRRLAAQKPDCLRQKRPGWTPGLNFATVHAQQPGVIIVLNLALAQELVGLAAHHQKSYVFPNHETLRRNLRRHHGIDLSARTLCRHLATLEGAGWIARRTRHRHCATRGWTFRSTLYTILGPCWHWARKFTSKVRDFCRFSRVPSLAHNPTTEGSSPGLTAAIPPPPRNQKGSAAQFAASARKLLRR